MNKKALTYDDIQLVPAHSEIISRNDINLRTKVSRRYGLLIPLVASPMDTVCDATMAIKMAELGGVGCIHRFMSIEEQARQVSLTRARIYGEGFGGMFEYWGILDNDWHTDIREVPVMAAIGVKDEDKKRAEALANHHVNILVIDVAHGHHTNVINMIKWCKDNLAENIDIIAGNIATPEAAYALEKAGADGLRVGIGGGSLCTTRLKTGFGVPNVTAIEEISNIANTPIMADGGIRYSGDIAKALGVGADTVMLGSLLAGTKESPGKVVENTDGSLWKRFRGSASIDVKTDHNQSTRNVEGEATIIPFKGGATFVVQGLLDGLRSALSYDGANNLSEFKPEYVEVTNSGINEAKPHLLK